MSTAVVCLDFRNVCNTTFCPVLLYKLFRIEVLTNLFKPIHVCQTGSSKFQLQEKFVWQEENKQGRTGFYSVPNPITDGLKTPGDYLTLFADKNC